MDAAQWWNTQGVLGPRGPAVYGRGLPKTHFFAQARVVLSVATRRSVEVFDPPLSWTLWRLSANTEQALERAVQEWLDDLPPWKPFFQALQECDGQDLLGWLTGLDLIGPQTVAEAEQLRRSADGRAVLLPGIRDEDANTVALLAAGFFRGERGKLAVPYARTEA